MDQLPQAADSLKVIGAFLASNPSITQRSLHRAYGINYRSLTKWLRGDMVPDRPGPRSVLARLAADISTRGDQVRVRLGLNVAAGRSDYAPSSVTELRSIALKLSQSGDVLGAIGAARLAVESAASSELDSVWSSLAQYLYLLNRYLPSAAAVEIAEECLNPLLIRAEAKQLPINYRQGAASLGQLACMLAEGGQWRMASEVFQSRPVRELVEYSGPETWWKSGLVRGTARCRLWEGAPLDQVLDLADLAARVDGSADSLESVAAVRSEAHLIRGNATKAMEAIEPLYAAVRKHIEAGFDADTGKFTRRPLRRHFQGMVHYTYGALARYQTGAGRYGFNAALDDITCIEALIARDARLGRSNVKRMLGQTMNLPVRESRVHARFVGLTQGVCCERLDEFGVIHIRSLSSRLSKLLMH